MENIRINLLKIIKLNEVTYTEGFHNYYRFESKYQRWVILLNFFDKNYAPYAGFIPADFTIRFLSQPGISTGYLLAYTAEEIHEQRLAGTGPVHIDIIIHPNPVIQKRPTGFYFIFVNQLIHETTYIHDIFFSGGDIVSDHVEITATNNANNVTGSGIFKL